jgi:beta-lactamase class A
MKPGALGYTVVFLAALLLGVGVGQYTSAFLPGAHPDVPDRMDRTSGYQFVDPLLFCSDHEMSGQTAAFSRKLEDTLSDVIDTQKQSGMVTNASVLYRDLSNGPRVSVNGDLASEPASLLKVPLALSIHRRAQKDPEFLQKKVRMDLPDQNGSEYFKAPESARVGEEYTIDQLLDFSLVDSDNNATALLISQLSEEELRKSYEDLGIEVPVDNPTNYTMNVGVYSSFFRILYNASYLSRDASEQFLSDLSRSTFTAGIVAGIPKGTVVAHKFGEYSTENGRKQLHDCGIVYRPNRPYLLCVMTQGNDFEKLASSIASISKTVWELDQ